MKKINQYQKRRELCTLRYTTGHQVDAPTTQHNSMCGMAWPGGSIRW